MGITKKIKLWLSPESVAQVMDLHAEKCREADAYEEERPKMSDVVALLLLEALTARRKAARVAEERAAVAAKPEDEVAKEAADVIRRAQVTAVRRVADRMYAGRLNDLAKRVMDERHAAFRARAEVNGYQTPIGCSGEEIARRRAEAEAAAEASDKRAATLAADLARLRAEFEEASRLDE